ncbi:hypothetical protein FN3523_1841 [Francisella hispaniensis]|uniref:Uncharacterized protein n=1 Tax=Francisella hispaniensis TaxID=622488 RepID=F4BI50_9GAMM|nr:hypothetical protein FN3523_1841 [Francisella hispaniensis]
MATLYRFYIKKFKYYVSVSDGKQTIGALSPNSSIYHDIPGCASPA